MYVDGEVLPHYCETKRICANGCGAILSGYNQNSSGFCSLCESKRITAELDSGHFADLIEEEIAEREREDILSRMRANGREPNKCQREGCNNDVIGSVFKKYCSDECKREAGYNAANRTLKVCALESCGSPFHGRPNKRFCSPKCGWKFYYQQSDRFTNGKRRPRRKEEAVCE